MTWHWAGVATADAVYLVLFAYVLAHYCYYLTLLSVAAIARPVGPSARVTRSLWNRYDHRAPSIAILVPAFDEELSIVESVTSLLGQHYPNFQVIVINDGSNDTTLARLIDHFGLMPADRAYHLWVEHAPIRALYACDRERRLLVVDKEQGGSKADAINAGINVARAALVCVVDADSLLEADGLRRMVRPFVRDPQRTIAAGGCIRIINGCTVERGRITSIRAPSTWLAHFQIIEYLRAFLVARVAMGVLGTLTIVSGALGLFDRRVLLEIGGYDPRSSGEDLELVIRMHRYMREQRTPYRIAFVADTVCWTEVPETFRDLGLQRARWQRGAIETFVKHRELALNPAYGRIGLVAFGRIVIADFVSPIVVALGYLLVPVFWALGLLDTAHFFALIAVAASLGVFVGVSALLIEEIVLGRSPRARDLAVLALVAVAENFGYRQLNTYWRLRGFYDYFRGRTEWVKIARRGFDAG